jgi:tryptophan 2,3-dioxygenase
VKAQLTEYERYIRTGELLSLQKEPDERANHDELLFQVTHQVSELWMKAAEADLAEAGRLMRLATVEAGGQSADISPAREGALTSQYPSLQRAAHLLRRAALIEKVLADQLFVLKEMHQADYHQIRVGLGQGSGQDSPGFHGLARESQRLWHSFAGLLSELGVTPPGLLQEPWAHYELYQLAQAMMAVDEAFGAFRYSHMALARRVIGLDVVGTGGTNARHLEQGARALLFRELWDAVSALTNGYQGSYRAGDEPAGGGGGTGG